MLINFSDINATKLYINPGIGVRYSLGIKLGTPSAPASGCRMVTAGIHLYPSESRWFISRVEDETWSEAKSRESRK